MVRGNFSGLCFFGESMFSSTSKNIHTFIFRLYYLLAIISYIIKVKVDNTYLLAWHFIYDISVENTSLFRLPPVKIIYW